MTSRSPRNLRTIRSADVPETTAYGDCILVVDFGSQYTQLIARRVREQGVYCEIHPFDIGDDAIREFAPKGAILSGGPETVTEGWTPRIPDAVFDLGVPVLGICYGMQAMASQLGGVVAGSLHREFGHANLRVADQGLLAGLGEVLDVWMSHGDRVTALPPGFVATAESDNAPIAAMADPVRHLYGVQFHPEVTHTARGGEIIRRFVRDIAGCRGDWTAANIAQTCRRRCCARTRRRRARHPGSFRRGRLQRRRRALLSRAIGDQLTCVFVDNGLLRKDEVAEVEAAFGPSNALPINLVTVDGRGRVPRRA